MKSDFQFAAVNIKIEIAFVSSAHKLVKLFQKLLIRAICPLIPIVLIPK
jgi:hypothetical protein